MRFHSHEMKKTYFLHHKCKYHQLNAPRACCNYVGSSIWDVIWAVPDHVLYYGLLDGVQILSWVCVEWVVWSDHVRYVIILTGMLTADVHWPETPDRYISDREAAGILMEAQKSVSLPSYGSRHSQHSLRSLFWNSFGEMKTETNETVWLKSCCIKWMWIAAQSI